MFRRDIYPQFLTLQQEPASGVSNLYGKAVSFWTSHAIERSVLSCQTNGNQNGLL